MNSIIRSNLGGKTLFRLTIVLVIIVIIHFTRKSGIGEENLLRRFSAQRWELRRWSTKTTSNIDHNLLLFWRFIIIVSLSKRALWSHCTTRAKQESKGADGLPIFVISTIRCLELLLRNMTSGLGGFVYIAPSVHYRRDGGGVFDRISYFSRRVVCVSVYFSPSSIVLFRAVVSILSFILSLPCFRSKWSGLTNKQAKQNKTKQNKTPSTCI